MGNNCGCFDNELDKARETSAFADKNMQNQSILHPQAKLQSRLQEEDDERMKLYTPTDHPGYKYNQQLYQSKRKDNRGSEKPHDGTSGSTKLVN